MDSRLLESSVIDELHPVGPGFSSISPETISNIKTTSVMDRNSATGNAVRAGFCEMASDTPE